MKIFSGVTTPVSTYLVTPIVPDLRGGAFVPGEPCPCPAILVPVSSKGIAAQRTETACGLMRRVTTTTYTKDPCPPGDAVCAAAPALITRVTTLESSSGVEESSSTIYFSAEGEELESTPCGFLEEVSDVYTPSPPDPRVSYSSVTVIDDTVVDTVPAPASISLRGDDTGVFIGSIAAMSDSRPVVPNESSFRYDSSFNWVIDLTSWPTSRTWPEGFIFSGSLIWLRVMTTGRVDDFERPETTEVFSESFAITQSSRIWTSSRINSSVGGVAAEGDYASERYVIPEASLPILPFA
jgi:hypothetical protein